MALSKEQLQIISVSTFEEKFELPQANIPDLSHEPTPESR